MSKQTKLSATPFFFICAAIMLVMVILHFVPFWTVNGVTDSIASLTWWPLEHTELQAYLSQTAGTDFSINSFVWLPILQLVFAFLGAAACIFFSHYTVTAIIPLGVGILGIYSYLTNPFLQLGSGWVFHLIAAVLLLLVSLCTIAIGFMRHREAA